MRMLFWVRPSSSPHDGNGHAPTIELESLVALRWIGVRFEECRDLALLAPLLLGIAGGQRLTDDVAVAEHAMREPIRHAVRERMNGAGLTPPLAGDDAARAGDASP